MEGTIGEIRMFAGTFAPRSWAFCSGQLLSIAQNTALFSILGTTYGGNGQTNFALPDFRSRTALGTGQGPGLTNISLGEVAGTESANILVTNMPAHNHTVNANSGGGTTASPGGNFLAAGQDATGNPIPTYAASGTGGVNLNGVGIAGGSQPLPIRNPYLGMNYIICLEGIFPSRN